MKAIYQLPYRFWRKQGGGITQIQFSYIRRKKRKTRQNKSRNPKAAIKVALGSCSPPWGELERLFYSSLQSSWLLRT